MRRVIMWMTILTMLVGCQQAVEPPTWQVQYDLGVRYLSEGNYEEAIIAFTAAIEIDPKRVDAYIGLADVYVSRDDLEKAMEILKEGLLETGDPALQARLDEVSATSGELYNAYGATEFTLRKGFVPFGSLPTEEKQLMQTVAEAVIAGDYEALLNLATTDEEWNVDGPDMTFYTIYNDTKIKFILPRNCVNDDGDRLYLMEFALRPENGMGYYCRVQCSEKEDPSKAQHDAYYDYIREAEIVSCPCTDWQWNGKALYSGHEQSLQISEDGYSSISRVETTGTGMMVGSLYDGTITIETREINDLSHPDTGYISHDDVNTMVERQFVGGQLTTENGIAYETGSDWYYPIVEMTGHGYGYFDKQTMLDELYW